MFDNRRIKFILLCIVCAVLGFYAARILFDYIAETQNRGAALKPHFVAKKAEVVSTPVSLPILPPAPSTADGLKKQPIGEIKKSPRPVLALNGIVFSPGSSYALINNKIVKEGDEIEGVTVVRIAKDNVELKDGDTAFKISSNAKTF
jgi:type II secretory pathway component PulC